MAEVKVQESDTQVQPDVAASTPTDSGRVCVNCNSPAVCDTSDGFGNEVPVCHTHAVMAKANGDDLLVFGTKVPYELVPNSPLVIAQDSDGVFHEAKPFSDPEDAEPEPPVDPNSAEALAAYDAKTVLLINEEAEEVARYERAYDDAAEVAKEFKKDFERAEKALRELIEDRRKNRGKPTQPTLYKDPPAEKAEPLEASDGNNAQADVDACPPKDENSTGVWQGNHEFTPQELATPLSSLSIAQGVLNALNEGRKKDGSSFTPIVTVGDYFEYCKPLANGWVPNLRDIKGIGDGKADAFEKAILDFTEECCNAKRKAAA